MCAAGETWQGNQANSVTRVVGGPGGNVGRGRNVVGVGSVRGEPTSARRTVRGSYVAGGVGTTRVCVRLPTIANEREPNACATST